MIVCKNYMVKLFLLLFLVDLGDFLLGHGFSKTKWQPNKSESRAETTKV